jgi:hypothetical protein
VWIVTGGDRVPVDPDITPQSTSEFAVGGEYEIFKKGILGAQYTRRWMNSVIEDMSRDEGQTYFIGNPGSGIASDFPEATRTYDAMNIYFEKKWDGGDLVHWLANASYTLSYVRGNYAGLFRPESTQLDPNGNSDFDLISLLPNRDGPLPGDKTHQIKVYGAVEFTPKTFVGDVGIAFTTRSGEPQNYLGAHELYGDSEVYILPRGSGERLPWVHKFDLHLGACRAGVSAPRLLGRVGGDVLPPGGPVARYASDRLDRVSGAFEPRRRLGEHLSLPLHEALGRSTDGTVGREKAREQRVREVRHARHARTPHLRDAPSNAPEIAPHPRSLTMRG